MRIVHLSDIHLNKNDLKDFQEFVLPALIRDLDEYNSKQEIDLILITGDLIDKGGKSLGGVENALNLFMDNVIEPINKNLNLGYEKFYFVPGNHDIDEDADSKNIESGLTANLKDTNSVNKFIDANDLEGMTRVLSYKKFESEYYKNLLLKKDITNFQSSYLVNVEGRLVGINCLNTAWRCYDSKTDKGKILLGERQVTEAYKKIKDCDIKIALMHHQPDWLADFDNESTESLLFDNYDLLFCGHVHKGSSWNTNKSCRNLFFSIAPINFAGNIRNNDRSYSNGYTILDYNAETGSIILNYRRYNHNNFHGYVDNTDLSKDGKDVFKIPKKPYNKKKVYSESQIKQEMTVLDYGHSDVNYLGTNDILDEFIVEKKNFGVGFIVNKNFVNENLKVVSKYSFKYKYLINNIDLIILLIDKLLYKISLEDHNNEHTNNIIHLHEYFSKISEYSDKDKITVLKTIYDSIIWFWTKISSDIIPKLFPRELSVSNLVEHIVNCEGDSCSHDQYIKVLNGARETYSALDCENEYEVGKNSESSLKCQVILCLVLPIYIFKEKIMRWTSGLEIIKEEETDAKQLATVIKKEYLELQDSFAERDINIEFIYNKILENEVFIISGKNGTGKSSIIGKIVEKLSTEKYGEEFSLSIIIYSFKHSKNISDLIKSIINQTNCTLINKIDENILEQIPTEYNIWPGKVRQSSEIKINSTYNFYKKILQGVLANFIFEHGEVYIFIDSLELANDYEEDIKNLFTDLPSNSHIIFCTSNMNQSSDNMKPNKNIEKNVAIIEDLNKTEISNIFSLSCSDARNIEAIEKIYKKTSGNVKLIKSLIEKINISGIDILDYLENYCNQINDRNIEEFKKLANKWILFSTDILEDTLLILSIFETVNFISLDKIQSFLNYKGYNFRLPKIRKFLCKVDEQIVYSNNKVKLVNEEFAEFIIHNYFSRNDIEMFISDLFSWICKNIESDHGFVIDFFKYLVKKELINKKLLKSNFESFINKKKENNEHQYLYDMGILIYKTSNDMEEYAFNMVESAAMLNNYEAKTFLGYCYMVGEHVKQDISKAEELLNEACEAGNTMAKSIFGQILISGDYLTKDVEKGKRLLFEASAEGNIDAKLSLAIMLTFGHGIKSNPIQGREFLHELIREDNAKAMLIMGRFMLDGVAIERNMEEGLKLIEKAIDKGNIDAKFELAERLIYGHGVIEHKVEGFRILEEMVSLGNIKAKRKLAKLSVIKGDIKLGTKLLDELIKDKDTKTILSYWELITSKKLPEDKKELVLDLLNKEVKNCNIDAMRILGISLIKGEGVERNTEEGIRLLQDCVKKSDIDAMRILGDMLVNGINVAVDKERGETLLFKAAEQGDVESNILYALTLIKHHPDQGDINISLNILEEAASSGNIYAKLNLAEILSKGKIIKKDARRSLKLLEECVSWGDRQAARILGYKLLNGIDVPYDLNRSEELLNNARSNGDSLAKTILGEAIVNLKFPNYSIQEGINLLEEAACKDHMAEKILGILLIRGTNVPQDKDRGVALLKDSAEKGNMAAKRELYKMLLDGKYLEQDIDKGKKYLMDAIESDDHLAKIDFAIRLLEGNVISKNESEGERIFEELITQNDSDAMWRYGDILITGKGGIKNKPRGEKLLREAIELGNISAKRVLALNIIDNELESDTIEYAINLLEENVLESDESTMILYGEMLIDGEKITPNISKGIKLLEESCNRKNSVGQYYLGKRLVKGKKVEQDINKGVDLLERSFAASNWDAGMFLAEIYLKGKYVYKDINKGITILDSLVCEGYEEAEEMLALMLIKGDRIKRDYNKGIDLVNKLIEKRNTNIMIEYGEMLLDGFYIEKDLKLGQKLLNDAIREGDYFAAYKLGKRMLSGKGIKRHKSHAIKHLNKAIKHGIAVAKFEYGVRLKNGIDIPADKKEGKNIIDNMLSIDEIDNKYSFGVVAYKLKDYELASQLFYDAYINDVEEASVSLSYMIRRNEIKGEMQLPDLSDLLEKQIKNNDQNAKINLALNYVRKDMEYQDWDKVNEIFSQLDYCGEAADWWYQIAQDGDLEGELIIGLMDRYGLIPGINNRLFAERFNKINKNGWNIPDWMYLDVISYDETAITNE